MEELPWNLDDFICERPIRTCLNLSQTIKITIYRHSLGGQLIGYIGRSVYKYSSNTYKMPIITALDPGKQISMP